MSTPFRLATFGLAVGGWLAVAAAADIEREPINYATAAADNVVSRLQQRLDTGTATLAYDERLGWLPSLLGQLNVPTSSQLLVFSKTSFQRQRISPRTPRALYFNDDVYVGFCQRGEVLEVSAVDPQLGAVFYTLDQKKADRPRFVRQNDSCMICHGSSANQGFPGHLVRSLYVDDDGLPILSLGSHRIDQSSPLKERWGGWYVTGASGHQTHLGNLIVGNERQPESIDNSAGQNVTDLGKRCGTRSYLTPHSDIVALMVMEHQAEMHNRITRANMQTRLALFEEAELNKALGRPVGERSASTTRRIQYACEPLVQYMLCCGEAPLTEPVCGSCGFAKNFQERGPRDRRGRSLRELDLNKRLFRYPCSYLIYSAAFDGLPGEAKDYVWRRLWEVLTGADCSNEFQHLSLADRQAIREILMDTNSGLPNSWRVTEDKTGPKSK